MTGRKIRDYEVSIWSLQDDFIAILKAAHLENKGKTSEPKMVLKTDGTQELTFSIPMYLYNEKGVQEENPIWFNTRNGNLLINMRKIKIIFNKATEDEKVYDFLITNIVERHEEDQLYCDVTCEGLAFHELGKIGYKISLTSDAFYNEEYEWFENGQQTEQPRATLQYWVGKFLEPYPEDGRIISAATWYYKIEMDWSSYADGSDPEKRESNKIYEEPYTSSWGISADKNSLISSAVETYKEKERLIDLEESNIYNLTQDLAKTFGVFCRYEYGYDDNYHIISRTVIFYNNFIQEKEGYISLTYPYTTNSVQREIDSTELVTKMFVRPVENSASASGWSTIMDVDVNKSLEDYLLNFDYLYSIGSITLDQYQEIPKYEKKMRTLNEALILSEKMLEQLQYRKTEVEAALTMAQNAISLDQERISAANALRNELSQKYGDGGGTVTITNDNAKPAIVIKDDNGRYYLKISESGVIFDTVKVYKTINYQATKESEKLLDQILPLTPEYDEYGILTKIYLDGLEDAPDIVFLTYTYNPKLQYDSVAEIWGNRLQKDTAARDANQNELLSIERMERLNIASRDSNLAEKEKARKEFERLMGPALREGYWQPDDYNDYGTVYIDNLSFTKNKEATDGNEIEDSRGTSGLTTAIWDKEIFPTEQDYKYEQGADQQTKVYLCVDLSNYVDNIIGYLDKSLTFSFFDHEPRQGENDINRRIFAFGSQCQLGFSIRDGHVVPILILTGLTSLSNSIEENLYSPVIGIVKADKAESDKTYTTRIDPGWAVASTDFFKPSTILYPRIKISSPSLKTSDDQLSLKYNKNTQLENYIDYYLLTKAKEDNDNYYLTIEPKTMLRYYNTNTIPFSLKFTLSNASTSIYLDALKVLKENAYPKVSYTINPSAVNENFIYNDYNKLARIVNINDVELKFENVQGYISELNLDLDMPWQDTITISNYKTKFEDLFSTIVAQTQAMKKSEYAIGLASGLFSNGQLSGDVVQNSLHKVDLNYAFNNGTLTINEKDGIWGTSDSGVVAFRGGGIFTATEKDANGNWIWNTGIVPQGINADLITTGQLDTNRIKIYAGDEIRFQLNGDGIFAYKSVLDLLNNKDLKNEDRNTITNSAKNGLDFNQFVVMNRDGLFLRVLEGALVFNDKKKELKTIDEPINRVSISWDGLELRNYDNDRTFFADADTGSLYYSGNLWTDTGIILHDYDGTTEGDVQALSVYLQNQMENHVLVSKNLATLFGQAGELLQASLSSINALNEKQGFNTTMFAKFKQDLLSGLKDDREIKLYGSSSVDIYNGSADENGILNVISMTPENGIWLGSNKGINFYSAGYDSSANASINSEQILFGIKGADNATAVEMTQDYIVLGAASQLGALENATEEDWKKAKNPVSGVKITPEEIRLGAGTDTDRGLVSITPTDITLGVVGNNDSGSFVKLAKDEIKIGADSNMFIDTANFVLDTAKTASKSGTGFRIGPSGKDAALTYADGQLVVNGDITATSFTLSSGIIKGDDGKEKYNLNTMATSISVDYAASSSKTDIPGDDKWESDISQVELSSGDYLWTRTTYNYINKNPSVSYTISRNGTDGTNATIVISYLVSDNGTEQPRDNDPRWQSTLPDNITAGQYLWKRIKITQEGTTTQSYEVTYYPKDGEQGEDGISISSIVTQYQIYDSDAEASDLPSDKWETNVPDWSKANVTDKSVYWTREKYTWTKGDPTYSTPVINYALTVSNKNATSAMKKANEVSNATEPITSHGIEGPITWNNNTYGLVLGNKSASPMLIGSNSGITIASVNVKDGGSGNAAVVLDSSGIALNGSTISFVAGSENNSVFTMGKDGFNLGTQGGSFSLDSVGNIAITANSLKLNGAISGATNVVGKQRTKYYVVDGTTENDHFTSLMEAIDTLKSQGEMLQETVFIDVRTTCLENVTISNLLGTGILYIRFREEADGYAEGILRGSIFIQGCTVQIHICGYDPNTYTGTVEEQKIKRKKLSSTYRIIAPVNENNNRAYYSVEIFNSNFVQVYDLGIYGDALARDPEDEKPIHNQIRRGNGVHAGQGSNVLVENVRIDRTAYALSSTENSILGVINCYGGISPIGDDPTSKVNGSSLVVSMLGEIRVTGTAPYAAETEAYGVMGGFINKYGTVTYETESGESSVPEPSEPTIDTNSLILTATEAHSAISQWNGVIVYPYGWHYYAYPAIGSTAEGAWSSCMWNMGDLLEAKKFIQSKQNVTIQFVVEKETFTGNISELELFYRNDTFNVMNNSYVRVQDALNIHTSITQSTSTNKITYDISDTGIKNYILGATELWIGFRGPNPELDTSRYIPYISFNSNAKLIISGS